MLELFDLSLQVLKRHWWALVLTSAVFGGPLLLLDLWATAWMLNADTLLTVEQLEDPLTWMRWRHAWHLTTLFVLQFPLISLPTTVFLGNRIFHQAIPLRKLLRQLGTIAGRWLLILGVVRLGLAGLVLELFVDREQAFDPLIEFWFFVFAFGLVLFTRGLRPFAPEILGLELCPLRAESTKVINYRVRSRALHRYTSSENLPRFLGATCYGTLLVCMLIGAQMFVLGASTGQWSWNAWFDYAGLALSLWAVGIFVSVFRFLSYLDNRIRLEGWEIELRLKAEGARLAQAQPIGTEAKSSATLSAVSRLVALTCLSLGTLASLGSGRLLAAPQSAAKLSTQRAAQTLPIQGWYDKQTGEFVPPQVSPAEDDPLRTQGKTIQSPPPTAPKNPGRTWNWGQSGIAQVLQAFAFAILAAGLLILLGLLTYYSLRDYLPERFHSPPPRASLNIDPARLVDLPFESKPTADDPLGAAERAMRAENYDEAIAYLYGYLLLALDQTRLIHLQKGKTNRMYLRELGNRKPLRAIVEAAMLIFESSYFGKHAVTREQFQTVWQQVEPFHQLLPAHAASTGSPSAAQPKLASGLLLAIICVATSGCGNWLPDTGAFGSVNSPDANRSLNGLGLFRKLWEASGAKCLTPQRLSPKLNDFDVIVLVGQSSEPPGIAARRWLESWLAAGSSRTVIYFGRDFNADIFYRQQTLGQLSDAERRRGQELIALRQAEEFQLRLQQLPEAVFCEWFYIDVQRVWHDYQSFTGPWTREGLDLDEIPGGWPVGVALQPPDSPTWNRKLSQRGPPTQPSKPLVPISTRSAQAEEISQQSMRLSRWNEEEFGTPEQWREAMRDPMESEVLLAADDGTPLVFRLSSTRLGAGQIMIVANGFPLLNGSLVTPLGAAIGERLVAACGPAQRVALLAFGQDGLTISQTVESDQRGAGLEMLTVWPLSAITMPAALLGIIACAAWWPIVGRPQPLAKRSVSDFGLHVDAIGRLMMETRDAAFATQAIDEYFRKVRGEAPPAWLGEVVPKE